MGRLFWKIFLCFWATLLLVGGAVGIIVWLQNSKRINELELLVNNPRAEMGVAAIANALRYGGEAAVKEIQNNQKSRHIHNRPVQRVLIVNDNDQDLLGRPVPKATIERARLALNTPEQGATQQVVSPSGKRYTLFVPQTMSRPFRRTAFSGPPQPSPDRSVCRQYYFQCLACMVSHQTHKFDSERRQKIGRGSTGNPHRS